MSRLSAANDAFGALLACAVVEFVKQFGWVYPLCGHYND